MAQENIAVAVEKKLKKRTYKRKKTTKKKTKKKGEKKEDKGNQVPESLDSSVSPTISEDMENRALNPTSENLSISTKKTISGKHTNNLVVAMTQKKSRMAAEDQHMVNADKTQADKLEEAETEAAKKVKEERVKGDDAKDEQKEKAREKTMEKEEEAKKSSESQTINTPVPGSTSSNTFKVTHYETKKHDAIYEYHNYYCSQESGVEYDGKKIGKELDSNTNYDARGKKSELLSTVLTAVFPVE